MKPYKDPYINATFDHENKRVFFFGGIFSQWYKAPIHDDLFDYNCNEQAMMACKAMLFGDNITAKMIINTNNPAEQKRLGREVKNYDDKVWCEKRFDIVTEINYRKFTQNPQLKSILMMLKDWEFVEASPYDVIWGIGLGETAEGVFDPTNWRGQNLLGKAIKAAQTRIFNEL